MGAAADERARQIEYAQARGEQWEQPARPRPRPDLDTACRDYLTDRARVLAPRTLHRHGEALTLLLCYAATLEAVEVHALSKSLLPGFWTWLEQPEIGRHGEARPADTVRKIVEVVQLLWTRLYEDDVYHPHVLPPRRLQMPRCVQGSVPVAPSWAQMDAVIARLRPASWQRRAAVLARCTGLRRAELLSLTWEDLLSSGAIVQQHNATKGGMTGRLLPLAPVLLAELEGWPRTGVTMVDGPELERTARGHVDRDLRRAWKAVGVHESVWKGRPLHAFRKGFISRLRSLHADPDAVRYLVGHTLGGAGAHGRYLDPEALGVWDVVKLIPPIGGTVS